MGDPLGRPLLLDQEVVAQAGLVGVAAAGAVPAPWQIDTRYEAGVMSDGAAPEGSRAFILFISRPEARAKWTAAKFDPP